MDPQRTRYGYGSPWSPAGLVHALRRTSSSPPARRRCLHGGVVVVFMVHLEWGPSSTSNIRPSGRSLTSDYYIHKYCKLPRLGNGGAQFAAHRPLLSLELGTPWLAYGFALAADTLVDPLQRGLLACPGTVSMAARRMSHLPKKVVVCFYRPFRPLP